jgi:hypothetical protein
LQDLGIKFFASDPVSKDDGKSGGPFKLFDIGVAIHINYFVKSMGYGMK